jgi:hypothetical protein
LLVNPLFDNGVKQFGRSANLSAANLLVAAAACATTSQAPLLFAAHPCTLSVIVTRLVQQLTVWHGLIG